MEAPQIQLMRSVANKALCSEVFGVSEDQSAFDHTDDAENG
jgi:hypothetical protein